MCPLLYFKLVGFFSSSVQNRFRKIQNKLFFSICSCSSKSLLLAFGTRFPVVCCAKFLWCEKAQIRKCEMQLVWLDFARMIDPGVEFDLFSCPARVLFCA